MKTNLFNLLATLGFAQFACASPYEGRTLQSAFLLQAQDTELLEAINQCDADIQGCDQAINRLQLEIPILQRKAKIQRTIRVISWPVRAVHQGWTRIADRKTQALM